MSICDFNTSFWYFLSTWPIPRGTPNVFAPSGTQASCTAQGFFIQFGIATPLYNAALAFYYLLIIRYQWKEERMNEKAQKYLLSVPLVWASGTSLAALGLTLLNNANLWCWISSVPLGCKGSHRNNGVNDCERGNNQWIYRWAFFYGPLWAAIFLSGVAMLLTYMAVVRTERASSKWKSATTATYDPTNSAARKKKEKEENDRKHSKQVSSQAFYYLLAFFFSWTPATLTRFIQMIGLKTPYALLLLMAIFTPMQGFLNYLVYMRPRWINYRKRHPEWGRCMAFAMVFRGGLNKQTKSSVAQETTRGKYFSAVHRKTSASRASRASRRSSVSRRSSNDVGSVAQMDSEEHKEEERPYDEERPYPCDDNVDPKVTSGDGEEESPSHVENGTCAVVVRASIFSSFIPDESFLQDEFEFEDDEKVPSENGDGGVAQ
jgi:hypothetical protein